MQGLSVAAGMEKGAVKNIMRGRSIHPRIDTVEKFATALGCSPFELLPTWWCRPTSLQAQEIDEAMLCEAMDYYLKGVKLGLFRRDETAEEIAHMLTLSYKMFCKEKIGIKSVKRLID